MSQKTSTRWDLGTQKQGQWAPVNINKIRVINNNNTKSYLRSQFWVWGKKKKKTFITLISTSQKNCTSWESVPHAKQRKKGVQF